MSEEEQVPVERYLTCLSNTLGESESNLNLAEVHRALIEGLVRLPAPQGLAGLHQEMLEKLQLPRIEEMGRKIQLKPDKTIYDTVTSIERLHSRLRKEAEEKKFSE